MRAPLIRHYSGVVSCVLCSRLGSCSRNLHTVRPRNTGCRFSRRLSILIARVRILRLLCLRNSRQWGLHCLLMREWGQQLDFRVDGVCSHIQLEARLCVLRQHGRVQVAGVRPVRSDRRSIHCGISLHVRRIHDDIEIRYAPHKHGRLSLIGTRLGCCNERML